MTEPERMQIPPVAVYGQRAVDTSPEGDQSTDAIVDKIAQAVAERLSASADGYRAAQNWIEVAIDPKLSKRTLRGLHDALAAITAAQQKLDADRVAHDEHIAKSNAELREREKTAGSMWARAKAAETAMATREQAVKEKEHELGLDYVPPSSFVASEGSTITQSPPPPAPRPHTVRHDPMGNAFTPGSTLTMTVPGGELPPLIEGVVVPEVPMSTNTVSARRPGRPRKSASPSPQPSAE